MAEMITIDDLERQAKYDTDKAWCFDKYDTRKKRNERLWFPKSQCEVEDFGDGRAEITMPEWLAERNGLI